MSELIRVPDIGSGEGEVIELFVKVGDTVEADQSLLTLESDKASMEIPAPKAGVVKAINAKGAGDWSRGDVEKLADIAAENGAKGMAWIAFTTDGKEKSPIIKFFSDEEFAALKEAMDVEPGDLLLFAADTYEVASAVLSALRLHMADALDVPREGHQLLWVVNFPMFKYDEDEKK